MANWWDSAPLAEATPDKGNWWDRAQPAGEDIPPAPTGAIIHGSDGVSRVANMPALSTTRTGDAQTDTGRAAILAERAAGNDMGAFRRSLMPLFQGMTFGWGDEAVAGLKALTGGSYDAKHEMMRQELERQRAEHPVGSAVSEIAGGVGAGLGVAGSGATLMRAGMSLPKLAMAGAAEGAGYGALYGAGEAADGSRLSGAGKGAITGGLIGAGVPVAARGIGGAIGRAITPTQITPERQALVDLLEQNGIKATAGQRSGSKALQYAENFLGDAPLAGGKATKAMEAQGGAFTNAAMQKMGGSGLATPDNMTRNFDRIGRSFNDLSARNTLVADAQFNQDIGDTLRNYAVLLPEQRKQAISATVSDLIDRLRAGNGSMPGDQYQAIRSKIGKMAQTTRQSDPEFSGALKGIRDAMDGAMNRSVSPQDAAAWQEARRQYGNYKTLEKAVGGAGSNNAEGRISPQGLRAAIAQGGNKGAYVRGQGDFADLARAGNAIMSPLPNSGTAQRNFLAGATGGATLAGSPLTAAASLGIPAMAGRAIMSAPVQKYLSNQALSPFMRAVIERQIRAGLMGGAESQSPDIQLPLLPR